MLIRSSPGLQAREALRRREEEAARNDHEAKLDELAVQIEDATRKTQRLRARRDQLAQSAESTARLRVKRQDLTAKEQHLKSLITGNRTAIEGALGVAPGVSVTQLPAGDVVRMLQQGLAEKKGEMDDVERRATGAAREAAVKESEVAARRGEVEKLEREERAIQRDLDGLMGGASGAPSQAASLDKKVEDLERELREEDEIQQVAGHLRTFWEKQQKKGRKNNACGVCLRAFRGDDDSAAFFSHCQAEVRKCVAIQEQDAGAREAQRRKLEAFKVAQPRWARLRELQLTALPEAREALGRAEEEARALRAAAESAEVAAEMARAEFAQADAVASGVGGEIERAERDLAALREEISELEARAGPRSGADDIEAVSRELDSEETRRATLEREREGVMRAQAAARDALQGVHNAWRDAKEELAGVRARVKEAEDLRARLSEAESERERAVEEETWLRSEEEPLGGRRTELQRERERRRGAAARSERSMEEAVGSVRSVLSRAQQACDLADSAARKGAAEELRRLEKEIARQKAGQAGAEKEVEDLREKLEALTQTDMQADAMRKEIQAVIDIKRAERDVSALGRQVQEALAEQAAIGDPRGLREEAEAAGGRLEKARRNRNLSEGALKTVQLQLNRTRESLRGAEYRNIDEKFRSKR